MSTIHIDRYLDLDRKNPVGVFYYVGYYVGSSFHASYTCTSYAEAYDSLCEHVRMFPDRNYTLVTVHCIISKSNNYDSRAI